MRMVKFSVEKELEHIREMANASLVVPEELIETGDERYNVPKETPKASEEDITHTIDNTSIYRSAKEAILKAQRKQVGYGLDKYPEPLNADSWTVIETIDHIIEESVDKLHYLTMLREKLVLGIEERPYLDMRKMMEEARNRRG